MDRWREVKDSFLRGLEKIWYPSVCVQCHKRMVGGLVSKAYGYDLTFCSMECGDAYWHEYNRFTRDPTSYQLQQGPRICRLPGCNKPCYQESSKVHDYCGRTHAREHGAMGGSASPKGGRSTGYYQQNSGGHASANHNSSSQFTSGYQSGWSQSGPILFYNRGEPYYEFTNFYEAVVTIDGEDWLTTEHYFQAQKFVGTPLVGTIRMLERPREAFDKSRDPRYSSWRRRDWEDVKEDVMYKALQAKFTQHEKLGRQLRETGERKLIEHSPYDSYWGDGGDGSGKNRLGILLMKLRREMKPKPSVSAPSPPSPIHSRPPPPTTIAEWLQKDGSTGSGLSSTTSSHSGSEKPSGQPSPPAGSRSEQPLFSKTENPPPVDTHYGGTPPSVPPVSSSATGLPTTTTTTQHTPDKAAYGTQPAIVNQSDIPVSSSGTVFTQPSTVTTQQHNVSSRAVPSPRPLLSQQERPMTTTPPSSYQGTSPSTIATPSDFPSTSQYPYSPMSNVTPAAAGSATLQATADQSNLIGDYKLQPETSGSLDTSTLERKPLHREPQPPQHPKASYASKVAHGTQTPPVQAQQTQPQPQVAAGPPEPMDTS